MMEESEIYKIPYLPKDVLVLIGLELNLSDLFSLCAASKVYNEAVCENQKFWLNRINMRKGKKNVDLKGIKDYKKHYIDNVDKYEPIIIPDHKDIEKAHENMYYIKIGTDDKVYITQAENIWKVRPDFVFLPAFRVAGFPNEILRRLVREGYPPGGDNGVKAHIEAGYNGHNYKNDPYFWEELEKTKEFLKKQKNS